MAAALIGNERLLSRWETGERAALGASSVIPVSREKERAAAATAAVAVAAAVAAAVAMAVVVVGSVCR
jgi:hypothetical protein